MLNISDISNNLEFKDGIWYSKTRSNVSYPDYGNDLCYQVEDNSFWFKHRNNCIIAILKNFPPESELFDIGGGNGFVAMNLERNGFKTVLVEQGNIGVINAGKRELPNIICSTLEDADFKQESISAIGLFDVLEHIKEDLDFLKCIRNVLIKKGRFYLTVPAFNYLWSEEDNLSGHYRRYSKNSISDLLITVGFKIEYCSYNFLFLPVPIFLLRALLYKLGFRMKEKVIENATKAHRPVNKFVSNMIEKFLNFELGWIKMKKSIPFGGSIIIVAAKE